MRPTNETKKTPHSEELLSSFFFFVLGVREREDVREAPPKEGKTAGLEGVRPSSCRDRDRYYYRTTTTVSSQYERRDGVVLSVREDGIGEVIA